VSSILIWMDSYFIVRYRPVGETIEAQTFWGALIIGLLAATFLAFYIPLVKGRAMRAMPKMATPHHSIPEARDK
jgi:hypothetical protein